MSGNRRYSPRRMRELVLYVLSEAGPMPYEKLCNVLARIDFEAYRLTGRSLTGATYVKREWGMEPCKRSHKTTPDRRLRENRTA